MKKLCSVVLNTLNNDSRVKKIGNTLSRYFEVHFTGVSNEYITKFFITDTLENHKVYRIKYGVKEGKIKSVKNRAMQNRTSLNPLKLLKDIAWQIRLHYILFRTLVYENTDIYYCNDFNTLIAGYYASRKKRAKLIYDSHELWSERAGSRNNLYMRIKRVIEYFLEWLFIRRCDLVITVSNGIADELVSRYSINKPLVIRNLDIKKELPEKDTINKIRQSLNIPEGCILIVYQGVLSNERGIPELIDSIALLPDKYHLLLMGWNQCNISLNNERIHYIGAVNESNLHKYSSIADIGIHPMKSVNILNHILAFPNKFSQYLNAGIAVLLYDSPESRSIIDECKCGLTLIEIEAGYIAERIQYIMDNNDLQAMKQNARKCFIKHYNWNIDEKKLLNAMWDKL